MALSNRDPFTDNSASLKSFPDHVLLDIARNDAAQKEYRLLAVEVLQARKSPRIQHPDIQHLVRELEIELDGIIFEHPSPSGPGPLKAGVTVATLYGSDIIENQTTSTSEIFSASIPFTEPRKETVDAPPPQ